MGNSALSLGMTVLRALLSRLLTLLGILTLPLFFFFFQAEDGIRDADVTGVQTCALPISVFASWIAPFDPHEQFFDGLTIEGAPLPPNEMFWFGTDLLGRDLFSRILYGAQTSLIIGLVANGAVLFIGTLVGVTAGYFRGVIGGVLMRFTDLMMAFPALLL